MKISVALGTALYILALVPGSVGADDGDVESLLRSRKLPKTNLFSGNTKDFKSTGIVGSFLKPPFPGNVNQPDKLKTLILGAFSGCVDDWEELEVGVEDEHVSCDVYFNPHTSKFWGWIANGKHVIMTLHDYSRFNFL